MWPINLSVRLPIVDLVGHYPANYLIGRESIFQRIAPLIRSPCDVLMLCGISVLFKTLSPSERQVTHALLTRPPLTFIPEGNQSVRLACVRHAASVRPEPGSNSLKTVSYLRSPRAKINFQSLLALSSADDFNFWFIHRISPRIYRLLFRVSKKLRVSFKFRLLFNFQGPYLFALSSAQTLYHFSLALSRTFLSFFQLFFGFPLLHCFRISLSLSGELV